jgi:methyl-accepting chemotaxis protein/methyl-accepting chemotaxis protein-1 (serine sensor receptor)
LGVATCAGCGLLLFLVRGIKRALRSAIDELTQGSAHVASAAAQISGASQSLAQGSTEQAAALQQTSASAEEIGSMVRRNNESASASAALVGQSIEKYQAANGWLGEMQAAMSEINESSGKIARIIRVIDEIAFQTNLLALNAAVEAARAGEGGMGFAVVADEVRNLAQRCAQAAKDTAGLIEESIGKSDNGKQKVDRLAEAIRAITEDSARIRALVDEVSQGSREQSRGIEQVGKALAQMEQVTHKTAANAEQNASASEELTAQSEALREVVVRLSSLV